MKVGMMVGLGLGIASVFGCAHDVSEGNTPLVPRAAAPTPLVPEAYTVLAAAVAPAASPPAPALAVAARAVPSPASNWNQYHPYWMVDVH